MTTEHPDAAKPIRRLYCTCCGAVIRGRQFHNQDTGHGMGACCIDFASRNMSADDVRRTWGVRGVHFDLTETR